MDRTKELRRSIASTLAFMLLVTLIAPAGLWPGNAGAAETNLIANGGFEDELNGWNTGGNAKFTVTDATYRSGAYGLQIDGPQNWNGIKYTVSVAPDSDYKLSFYGKGGGGAAFKVLAADETTIVEQYTSANDDWHLYEASFNSGANASIIIYLSDAGQTAYYDDFALVRVLPNLIENGGFESGLDGWNTGGNAKFAVTDAEFRSGKSGLRIDGPQDWNGAKYTVAVRPDTNYALTFYGKGGGGAVAKILAADETMIAEQYTGAHDDWHLYELGFNSGANESIIVYLSDAGQTAFYDDFYIGDPVLPDPKPVVANVTINGEAGVTKTLTGSYDYTHPADIEEGYSSYRWLRADTADGEYAAIPGAVGPTFVPTAETAGKYIKLEVTPVDRRGLAGLAVRSEAVGPVAAASAVDVARFALNGAIGEAAAMRDAAQIGPAIGQYPEPAWSGFDQAIQAAMAVAEDGAATVDGLEDAAAALAAAAAAFDGARNKQPSPLTHFITTDGTKLMDGDEELRFISYNYPGALFNEDEGEGLVPTPFEQEDAIRTIAQSDGQVFRTYTLTVRDKEDAPDAVRHIDGPGIINEEAFVSLDKLLQLANQYQVRVIIPFIDNWDWPPGGITDFAHFRGKERMDFYTDPQLIEDFKRVLDQVMNRVNSFTGVKYKDDPAILAWETGNELMVAPEWMHEIAAYYKSINPNQLLISGNQMELPHFYRNISDAALADPNIDIVKSHYYSGNYAVRVAEDKALADAHGKPFLVGEFGFKPTSEVNAMLDAVIETGTTGAMIWSLRPHSYSGGLIRHTEYDPGDGITYRSYHWPGFPSGDYQDATTIVHLLREKAYAIQGKEVPQLPVPEPAPELIETDSISELRWRGSTGASAYTVERAESAGGPWTVVGERVLDDVEPGGIMFADTTAISGNTYYYRVKGMNDSGETGYSNVLGPITAKFVLTDAMAGGEAKPYYATDDAVVYRVPSEIRSFAVEAETAADASGDFAFELSADGLAFTAATPVKDGKTYVLSASTVAGANQLRIVYPGGDKTKGELTRVSIEYTGNGQALLPVKPLLASGVLTDEMEDGTVLFNSRNVDYAEGPLTGSSAFPQVGRLQAAVGDGRIAFPAEPEAHVVENAELYGGESLLVEQAYAPVAEGGDIRLALDDTVAKSGSYSIRATYDMGDAGSAGMKKTLAEADRSGYDTLQLWVKPDGSERELTVKLMTKDGQAWSRSVTVAGSAGRTINLPIGSFTAEGDSASGGPDMRELQAFALYVNKGEGAASGTLHLDDVRFVQTRVIDSFDDYADPAAFASRYGTRNGSGGMIAGTLSDEYSASGTHAMRLDYDLEGPGYAGLITQLPSVDWSPYDTVRMWVKPGAESVKFTVQVKMGSTQVMESTVTLTGGAEAGIIDIPFADFDYPSWYGGTGTLDPREIVEFNLYFGQEGASTSGTVYVDQIELVNKAEPAAAQAASAAVSDPAGETATQGEAPAVARAATAAEAAVPDASRIVRKGSSETYLLYRSLADMNAFKLETYYAKQPTEAEYFTFYGSTDGSTFTKLEADVRYLGGAWHKTNYELQQLPAGVKLLRIEWPAQPSAPGPGPSNPGSSGPDPKPSPVETGAGSVTVPATPNADGHAEVVLKAADIDKALADHDGGEFLIRLTPGEGTKRIKVSLPVRQLADRASGIKIDAGLAVVRIDSRLLGSADHASAEQMELVVALVEAGSLPAGAQAQLAGAAVYDFELSLDGRKLGGFGGHDVLVSIPYELAEGEKPGKIVIYYVNDDGQLSIVKSGKYDPASGMVNFRAAHFSLYAAAAVDATFSDLARTPWAVDSIEALAARGMVQGIGGGKFDPSGEVTRGAFIQMLMNAFDLVDVADSASTFSDVAADDWYADAVASAEKRGIVKGMEDGTFRADAVITRQDMAVMLHRAIQQLELQMEDAGTAAAFADADAIGGYAREAVNALQRAGIVRGMEDGSFAPKGVATRAEAAVMLYRVYAGQ